jgi:hypothetical protein
MSKNEGEQKEINVRLMHKKKYPWYCPEQGKQCDTQAAAVGSSPRQ